ncbi:MAG: PH domain-containing protein, partial [Acidobacteria bacterium]|nr:PH domain-containing protein [Acidobacteriota bacterium]
MADRVSLQVQTAGGKAGENGESTRTWLAPLVQKTSLPELMAAILPEVATDVAWQSVHPRGVRREFAGMMIVVLPIFAALIWAVGWRALIVLPILLGWSLLYAQRTVAALRWGLSNDAVHFASGWIWRSVLAAPLTKVQVVARHEGPFDRRHGMARVSADTAGRQMSGYSITIPYLAAAVAATLAERLSAAAARTPFRW